MAAALAGRGATWMEVKGKRGYPRIPVQLAVDFRKVDQAEAPYIATALDISCGGLFIETLRSFAVGDHLAVELRLAGGEPRVALVGVVRWCKERAPKDGALRIPAGVGIEIVQIDAPDAQRLERLIDESQPEIVHEDS